MSALAFDPWAATGLTRPAQAVSRLAGLAGLAAELPPDEKSRADDGQPAHGRATAVWLPPASPDEQAAGRAAIAAEEPVCAGRDPIPPPAEMVEALAEAMAARPGHRITNRDNAMEYFRADARRRLSLTNDTLARGLLLGFQQHRRTDDGQ